MVCLIDQCKEVVAYIKSIDMQHISSCPNSTIVKTRSGNIVMFSMIGDIINTISSKCFCSHRKEDLIHFTINSVPVCECHE